MKRYLHHIGDWALDTSALPWLELAAYHKLIEAYYAAEKPLPGEAREVYRIIGASTVNEKRATLFVLKKFFKLESDGLWHQKRCDKEIGLAGEYRTQQAELSARRWGNPNGAPKAPLNGAHPGVSFSKKGFSCVTLDYGAVRQSTATNDDEQTSHPIGNAKAFNSNSNTSLAGRISERVSALVARAREKGVRLTESDPVLLALFSAGATDGEFADALDRAVSAGKAGPWMLAAVAGRRADASKTRLEGPSRASRENLSTAYIKPRER